MTPPRTSLRRLALIILLAATTVIAQTSDVTISSTPATSPEWKPGFPSTDDVEPREYKNPAWNQSYTCTNSKYSDIHFNLVDPPNCGTRLSQDLYGWGVRIGFYTTWFGSLFANTFVPSEVRSAIDANSIFLFALEVSVVKATFYDKNLMKVDALILFLIGSGTALGALSLWGRRTRFWYTGKREDIKSDFGGVGTYARLLLSFFLGLYGLWFWYSPFKPGLLLAGSCDPRCWTAYVFGVRLFSGVRWLFFTFSFLWELYWTFLLLLLAVCIFPPIRSAWRTLSQRAWEIATGSRGNVHPSKLSSRWTEFIAPSCNLLWYVFIITLIEVTLHQNRALGTLISAPASTSPSQLIPFLIGAITLVRLIWVYCTNGYKIRLGDLHPFVVYEDIRGPSNASQPEKVDSHKSAV